jgi:hypothetical protein
VVVGDCLACGRVCDALRKKRSSKIHWAPKFHRRAKNAKSQSQTRPACRICSQWVCAQRMLVVLWSSVVIACAECCGATRIVWSFVCACRRTRQGFCEVLRVSVCVCVLQRKLERKRIVCESLLRALSCSSLLLFSSLRSGFFHSLTARTYTKYQNIHHGR